MSTFSLVVFAFSLASPLLGRAPALAPSAAALQQQEQPPAAPPGRPAPESPPAPTGRAVPAPVFSARNVKLVLTITDRPDTGEPSRKVVTMIVGDGHRGSIRSKGAQRRADGVMVPVSINVDAQAAILEGDVIRLSLGLEYTPVYPEAAATAAESSGQAQLNESLTLMVTPGRAMVVSEAADAATNRKMSVEVLATVMP